MKHTNMVIEIQFVHKNPKYYTKHYIEPVKRKTMTRLNIDFSVTSLFNIERIIYI